jgi:hypothetical protein
MSVMMMDDVYHDSVDDDDDNEEGMSGITAPPLPYLGL